MFIKHSRSSPSRPVRTVCCKIAPYTLWFTELPLTHIVSLYLLVQSFLLVSPVNYIVTQFRSFLKTYVYTFK